MLTFATFLTELTSAMALASSNLQSIRYDDETEELTVYFRSGAIYAYDNVPKETVEELKFADSKGQYFFLYIRDSFPFTQLRAPRPGFSNAFNTAKSTSQHHFGYIGNTSHSPENR